LSMLVETKATRPMPRICSDCITTFVRAYSPAPPRPAGQRETAPALPVSTLQPSDEHEEVERCR
jgi:hypothetical protein